MEELERVTFILANGESVSIDKNISELSFWTKFPNPMKEEFYL